MFSYRRLAADSDSVGDATRVSVVDESDDSRITHQSLDRANDTNYTPGFTGPVNEIKQELSQDVKTEDARENDIECPEFSVKVSKSLVYAIHILMFSKHDDGFTATSEMDRLI